MRFKFALLPRAIWKSFIVCDVNKLPLWRKHIGFFVDYTTGLAAKDAAKQDKAINDLIGYSEDFGAFVNSASPSLEKDAVAELVRAHAVTLKGVIDAQAAGDTLEMVAIFLRPSRLFLQKL